MILSFNQIERHQPLTSVEGIHNGNIIGRQFKIENIEIFLNTLGIGRFWNWYDTNINLQENKIFINICMYV